MEMEMVMLIQAIEFRFFRSKSHDRWDRLDLNIIIIVPTSVCYFYGGGASYIVLFRGIWHIKHAECQKSHIHEWL